MKYVKYIALFVTLGLLASCQQTDVFFDTATSGEDVLLNLECVTMGDKEVVVTKAWEGTTEAERYIRDLRVYIFSKSGSLVGYGLFGNNATTEKEYGYWRNLDNIRTKTGDVYIYGVANISTSQYPLSQADLELLTGIDPLDLGSSGLTLDVFKSINFTRTKDGLNPLDERYLMVGSVNDGNLVTIGRDANGAVITNPTTREQQELRLYRILSKNTVNISAGTGVTFTLTSYGLYNVPNGGSLVKTAEPTATFDTTYPEEFSRLLTTDQSSLTFYLPENMAGSGQNITNWQDREKNDYDANRVKSFTNAPENSTYLVLRGNFVKGDYQASVEYSIHLGDFGKDITDFNVERNFSYIYNVTINGVDDIIVEAKKEGDRPAEEGIVLKKANANSILEVDCHYEARTMTFTKEEVLAEADKGLMLRLETAFGTSRVLYVRTDAIYDGPTDEAKVLATYTNGTINQADLAKCIESGKELDYEWLHFVRNTTGNRMTNGDALTNVAKYPGDNNQLDGSLVNGTAHMDVFYFLRQLITDATAATPSVFFTNNSTTENVTCFIDENYYPDKSWAEYVNKEEDRVAYFLTEEVHVSDDNKSIYTVIKYAIKQKSIWTFYNPAMAETINAFGVESVSEERTSSRSDTSINSNRNDDNGFTAAKGYQTGQNFYSGSLDARAGEQNQYTTVLKACMSRNRDSDGNGTINNNEMKWYLATINQYKGLSVGIDILPTSARLFNINEMHNFTYGKNYDEVAEYHFYSASSGNNQIYWAEEVVSTSTVSTGGWGGYGYARHVRCMRTLESNSNGEKDPDTFYQIEDNIVDLSRVNPGALRPYHNGGFPTHYETDEQNKLYTRFEIAEARLPGNAVSYEMVKGTANTMLSADDDLCQQADGYGGAWRVPNARELSLMLIAVNLGSTDYWASTRFNGNRYGSNGTGYRPFSNTYGFAYTGERMSIEPGNSGYVRCVRDVQVANANAEYNNGGSLTE